MTSHRMQRVNTLIQRELGELCERYVAPHVHALLTVTKVHTSPDLRQATVFVSVMGDTAGQREALRLLEQNRVSFQREIAHRIKLKFTPVLGFRLDLTLAQADRVLAIIDQLQREEGPAPASAEVPPALG